MSERKVQFAEAGDEDIEAAFAIAAEGGKSDYSTTTDKRIKLKGKHSLDSDEEDNVIEYDVLEEDDIEGQEDDTIAFDEGVRITPFNMKEELEEGHFDTEGTYIFQKDKGEIRDNWMDNIDWVKVKEKKKNDQEEEEADESSSDSEMDEIDSISVYKKMVELMQPGENVLKALCRLGGGKGGSSKASASQRWKTKKQKTGQECTANTEDLNKLTGYADLLVQHGYLEIYQETYEKLTFLIKSDETKSAESRVNLPEDHLVRDIEVGRGKTVGHMLVIGDQGQTDQVRVAEKEERGRDRAVALDSVDADDALDMFADNIDDKSTDKKESTEKKENGATVAEGAAAAEDLSNQVMWEYRWKNEDEADLHGPHSSQEMHDWVEDNYFPDGVYCRKVGSNSEFYSSRRIDFELYT